MQKPIYLDYHATTPVDRRVLDVMLPYFLDCFGNPASSTHQFGWKAQEGVEEARRRLAALIGAAAREIIFTSGATESNTLAIRGCTDPPGGGRNEIVTSAIEHKSVLETCRRLAQAGWKVTHLPIAADGRVNLEAAREAITSRTLLVTVMFANNEIGTLQPIAELSQLAHAHGALLHTDAAQAAGKVPVDVDALGIDLLSMTAHKMYGPKGCGALYVRRKLELCPMIEGGGQERGVRAGTLNVPGIVGFGEAARICREEMAEEAARTARLRARLLEGLQQLGGIRVNGSLEHRLPQNLHVSFEHVESEELIVGIGDIAVSAGSACQSGKGGMSHVLQALHGAGAPHAAAVRFGLGRFTTEEEIDYTVDKFSAVVRHLRPSGQSLQPAQERS
ncbi:MAG TPA: cysteine desulfurase family protein [Vicinamibacterales bacterium]|nr:cysteine desulfurase family protein [Vicinamibacterales bacterium]